MKKSAGWIWINKIGKAWIEKNPSLIPPLFAENFKYYETPFSTPIKTKKELLKLWQDVPNSQKDITFDFEILSEINNDYLAHFHASFVRIKNYSKTALDGIFSVKLNNNNLCTEFKWWWNTEEAAKNFYSLIDAASLKNPTILNNFKHS